MLVIEDPKNFLFLSFRRQGDFGSMRFRDLSTQCICMIRYMYLPSCSIDDDDNMIMEKFSAVFY